MSPQDQFKQAVANNDATLLAQLLETHPDLKSQINDPLFSFDTPAIVQAASRGSRPMIDLLLAHGANVNQRSRWWAGGFGVLDCADPETASHLIQHGATVDAHAAARLGMLDQLRQLIAADPTLVHARGGDGKTPLHFASTVEIADYLLSQGANIDALDIDHESTPAQYLVESHPDIVRFLVQRGCRTDILLAAAIGDAALVAKHLDADPDCIRTRVDDQYFPKRNPRAGGCIYIWTLGSNQSAHQVAHKFGHPQVLQLLMDRSPNDIKLLAGFSLHDEPTIKALLEHHPNLIAALPDSALAQINHAARDEDLQTVRLMLAHNWPVNAGRDETPLHWAAFHGNLELAREILKHNPALEQKDRNHHGTPLDWAIHGSIHGWRCKTGNYPAVVDALLTAGAKPPAEANGTEPVNQLLRRHRIEPTE